jgi:SAM-dependent methyltransferase
MQEELWNKVSNEVSFNLAVDIVGFESHVEKEARILDLGCGYGRTCDLLHMAGYENIVGIDSSSEMIKRGNKEFPHLSLSISQADEVPYQDTTFDAVLLCAVLTCIPGFKQRERLLSEVYRVLKPSGIIHVVEFCSDEGETFESGLGVVMNHSKPDELKGLLGLFNILEFKEAPTKTMGGKTSKAMSFFAQKTT